MNIQVDRQRIINKFRRNGHFINKNSLQIVINHLGSINNPHKRLDEIIKKMNQMVIIDQQQINDGNVKLAIQLLNHKTESGESFSSYEKFLLHLKQWTIFQLSPYQTHQRFFVDKPNANLFKFTAQDYLQMNKNRFKQIKQYNITKIKNNKNYIYIGILYQKFAIEKNKIMLQNQINQIQLIFYQHSQIQCFLIPGCTYIAQGDFKNKDQQLYVSIISLPLPLPPIKNNLFDIKLKLICDNISLSKNNINFTQQDFQSYQVIYNKNENKCKPIFIFGNFHINTSQINRVKKIIKQYPYKTQCIILMISEQQHEQMDLKKQFTNNNQIIPIFIIPHINSEGPRILPKLPIFKNFYNVKILTNPSKFSIQGKQCLLLNYPIVRNLYSKSLIQKQITNINEIQIAKKVYRFLYSQYNVGITQKIFWKQSEYFNVNSQNLIFICDKTCPQINYHQNIGGFISVGNFEIDGDFVCFMPHYKQPIQLSKVQ